MNYFQPDTNIDDKRIFVQFSEKKQLIDLKFKNYFLIFFFALIFFLLLGAIYFILFGLKKDDLSNNFNLSPTPIPFVSLNPGEVVYFYPNYILSGDLTESSCKKLFPLVKKGAYDYKQVASRLVSLLLQDEEAGYFSPYSLVLAGKVADVELVENNYAYINFKDIDSLPFYGNPGKFLDENTRLPSCNVSLIVDMFNATFKANYGVKYVYFAIDGNVPKFYEMTRLVCPGTKSQCSRVDKVVNENVNIDFKDYLFFEKMKVSLPSGWDFETKSDFSYSYVVNDPFLMKLKISREKSFQEVLDCPKLLNVECIQKEIKNKIWIYYKKNVFTGYQHVFETDYQGYVYSLLIEVAGSESDYFNNILQSLFTSLEIVD
ncbi:MAG: hypothetical protein N2558_04375 [Patescibacteria group bacterium]|nr:hypothetical protein [Patescibacteria group bacterium]